MQKKQGISLIVLVITIIVMIILAASVVITLSNTGVIDRASEAVDATNEAQVQDLAALIWADAYMDNKRGQELADKVKEELDRQGVKEIDWIISVTDTGATLHKKDKTAGIYAADGTFTTFDTLISQNILTIEDGELYATNRGNNTGGGGCEDLLTGKLVIPNDGRVTWIGESGFSSYWNITEVIIPNGIIKIDDWAFAETDIPSVLYLPASIKEIGVCAFDYTSVSEIYYSGTISQWNAITIEESAFGMSGDVVHCADGDTTVIYK